MGRRLRIAVFAFPHSTFERGLLSGIHKYHAARDRWVFHLFRENPDTREALGQWRPDGVVGQIAALNDARVIDWLTQEQTPVVNTSSYQIDPRWPSVLLDNVAVGRMAAKHFLQRGYRNFGFHGNCFRGFSEQRRCGFLETIESAGGNCSTFYIPRLDGKDWCAQLYQEELAHWLKSLSYPAAVFAMGDHKALLISQVCQREGIRVRDQVALLGVDNDEKLCQFCDPPLSSVALPLERLGFEAAKLLDQLIAGQSPPTEPILLPPIGVVTRESTDILHIDEPQVAAALRFIHENVNQPIRVEDVLQAVPVSRSWLEYKFKELLGRTPADEIRRVHVERIKQLLSDTDLDMPAIVAHSGYSSPASMTQIFKRVTGQNPSQYRRSVRVQ